MLPPIAGSIDHQADLMVDRCCQRDLACPPGREELPACRCNPDPSSARPPTFGDVIAKVEPLTSARALRGPFDYALQGEMSALGVGSVVMVPFARRQVLGVVVELAEKSELPPERLAT